MREMDRAAAAGADAAAAGSAEERARLEFAAQREARGLARFVREEGASEVVAMDSSDDDGANFSQSRPAPAPAPRN